MQSFDAAPNPVDVDGIVAMQPLGICYLHIIRQFFVLWSSTKLDRAMSEHCKRNAQRHYCGTGASLTEYARQSRIQV